MFLLNHWISPLLPIGIMKDALRVRAVLQSAFVFDLLPRVSR